MAKKHGLVVPWTIELSKDETIPDFINYPVYTTQEINTIEDIFDHIADPELFAYLKKADNIMLNIILLQVKDYEIKDIAKKLKLTKNAVYKRIRVFRKNLPKKG